MNSLKPMGDGRALDLTKESLPDSSLVTASTNLHPPSSHQGKAHNSKKASKVRRRGRPRIEDVNGTDAGIRRAQIRTAQHKFQLKREVHIATLKQRLEEAGSRVSNLSSKLEHLQILLQQDGIASGADDSSRYFTEAFVELRSIAQTINPEHSATSKNGKGPLDLKSNAKGPFSPLEGARQILPKQPATNLLASAIVYSPKERNRHVEARETHTLSARRSSQSRFSYHYLNTPSSMLGAGRVDPFQTYSIGQSTEQTNEFIDYIVSTHFPGLCPSSNRNITSPLVTSFMPQAISNPLVLHALLYAASSLLNVRYSRPPEYNSAFRLFHKGQTLKYISQALKSNEQTWTDDTIFGILTLMTTSDSYKIPDRDCQIFYPPLTSLGWLDVYGSMEIAEEHVHALTFILNSRGGLENIEMPSLGRLVSSAYIRRGCVSFQSSPFPDIKDRNYSWRVYAGSRSFANIKAGLSLGFGFEKLERYGLTHQMMTVIRDMCNLTIVLDRYGRGIMGNLDLSDIADWRTTIQHSLLSLPIDECGGDDIQEADFKVYESCRLSMLIYAFAVTYPAPFHMESRKKLTAYLRTSLLTLSLHACPDEITRLLIWCLFLGGISAYRLSDRGWYILTVVKVLKGSQITSWRQTHGILLEFLWLNSSIYPGAEKMWSEIKALL
ncbi:hypothetical protein BP5796_07003 [Coleophoma crateriformis]|uniref:Transcription factor domain-containing protein n=1 Tax=Coleophoma crateriformis TaxID=565419 RepID=A0A3D8RQ19_9HELO|nr:hypothetical protein BP5796_07003 [Coleophoma crateriformis]